MLLDKSTVPAPLDKSKVPVPLDKPTVPVALDKSTEPALLDKSTVPVHGQAMVMSSDASDTHTERSGVAMAGTEQGEDFYIKFEENMTMEDLMKQLENYNYSDRFYDDWKMEWDILHDERWKVSVCVCVCA